MKSRLEKLQRQHELMREHLHWIESEIAAESGRATGFSPEGSHSEPSEQPPGIGAQTPASTSATQIGEIAVPPASLPEPDVKSLQSEVRSGCLLYAAILFGGLALLIGIVYWKY